MRLSKRETITSRPERSSRSLTWVFMYEVGVPVVNLTGAMGFTAVEKANLVSMEFREGRVTSSIL
jgi:hypothetical protein